MKILVTGAAGFIGSKLCCELAKQGHEVVGIDNINDYYDPNLKYGRLREFFVIEDPGTWPVRTSNPKSVDSAQAVSYPEMPWEQRFESPLYSNLSFVRADITNITYLRRLFGQEWFDKVVNLAAQAGVRYSIKNPMTYAQNNVVGFTNILECCREFNVKHLVYASSSSVYGGNTKVPFSETDPVESPVSIYAATKKSNELFAHVYANLYRLRSTGLRYFTVYGPWGRPDMAPILFSKAIQQGTPIEIFNNGDLSRDFTYIDDIVAGTMQVLLHDDDADEATAQVYNIGCGHPMPLMDFIEIIEQNIGKKAIRKFMPMQAGDVYQTYADTSRLEHDYGYKPSVRLQEGIRLFVEWYKEYYKL